MKVVSENRLMEIIAHGGADNFLVLGSNALTLLQPCEVFRDKDTEAIYATENDKEMIEKILDDLKIDHEVVIITDKKISRIRCGETILIARFRNGLFFSNATIYYPTDGNASKVRKIFGR